MAACFRPPRPKVRRVRLNRRQPDVSVDDLALMLQIDVELGHAGNFRRRLQKALDNAYLRGMTKN